MQTLMALVAGLVFGIGLILGGMTDPAKVQGFLDLAGEWNPSLVLVMGGAILVAILVFPLASKRERALLGDIMRIPSATRIDARLVFGSLAFGAGWGLAGFCPGPALASLTSGRFEVLLFTGAMLGGMGIFEVIESRAGKATSRTA